ncbi:hypothetical protein LJC06_04125, partial [Bacteroidales bacterium OttesenSCG-928-I14]|nr:hypothetical protein [Bacteroidales bacterium OttesenSCG-928-I14]
TLSKPTAALIPTRMTKTYSANENKNWEPERSFFHLLYERECRNHQVNPENIELMNSLFYYSLGIKKRDVEGADTLPEEVYPDLDVDKGLWIWGSPGCGKSTLLKTLGAFEVKLVELDRVYYNKSPRYPHARGFRVLNCPQITARFSGYGISAIESLTDNEGEPFNVGLDELGREAIPVRYFGTELNVMEYILQLRYELRKKCKTHITTNLTFEGVKRLYGVYILERVQEMFNHIHLEDINHRNK